MAYETEIARLEAILNSGASDVSTDVDRTAFDHKSIREQLAKLRRKQDATKRPRQAQADLSGF
jgi:uncharacterized protein (UPF0335 family)